MACFEARLSEMTQQERHLLLLFFIFLRPYGEYCEILALHLLIWMKSFVRFIP